MIDDFYMAIRLRVVCGIELQFGNRHPEKILPEVVDEDRVSITNNGLGHPVELDNAFHKFFCHMYMISQVVPWPHDPLTECIGPHLKFFKFLPLN